MRERANQRGQVLERGVDVRVGTVRGDERKVKQVLLNLLSNAVKFTPAGGTVAVTVTASNGDVMLTVTDTGIGIRPEFQAVLFDRFTQDEPPATRVPSGLGLGLAIVKQIVELHHGTVRGESPGLGQGSTFTVTLPLADH